MEVNHHSQLIVHFKCRKNLKCSVKLENVLYYIVVILPTQDNPVVSTNQKLITRNKYNILR